MKKLIGLILGTSILVSASVLANNDLAQISVEYCTTPENTLTYQIDPGTQTGICYMISNASSRKITVNIWFVDGTFTNDQWQNKACLSQHDTEQFGQYVSGYESTITLQPGETIRQEAILSYPKGMDWLYYGCLVYAIADDQKDTKPQGNFIILMRKAKFIDVIVGNPENAQEKGIILVPFTPEEGQNLSPNPHIRVYQDLADGKYIVQIKIKNISNVQQDILMTGMMNNIIGQKFMFTEARKILKGETLLITKKIERIPLYNFALKLKIINTPMTFGDIKPIIGITQEKTRFMIWNAVTFITWWVLIFLIVVVVFLIKDIKARQAYHIQKPIPSSTQVAPKTPSSKSSVRKPSSKKLSSPLGKSKKPSSSPTKKTTPKKKK